MTKIIDLTNLKFGKWNVLYKDFSNKKGNYWICKCECGTIKSVLSKNLRDGKSLSCGCIKKEKLKQNRIQPNDINEVGNKYERLLVIRKTKKEEVNSKRVYWHCLCDCGAYKNVRADSLRSGSIKSCGCLHSIGESKISQILENKNINFKRQVSFDDLKNKNGNLLFFDFGIYNKKNDLLYLIEYDGEQHFKFSDSGWNTKNHYEKTILHDKLKNEYCRNKNIQLIRIKYDEEINLEKVVKIINE